MLLELQKETSAEQKRLDAAKQNLDETYNAINQWVVGMDGCGDCLCGCGGCG